jgi:hypothetical protein
MDERLQTIADKIAAAMPGAVLDQAFAFGELTLTVDISRNIDVLKFLRDDEAAQFVSIIDISGADYPEREKRFDVVYHLLSPRLNRRIRIKLATDEETPVASATDVLPGIPGVRFPEPMGRTAGAWGLEGYGRRSAIGSRNRLDLRVQQEAMRLAERNTRFSGDLPCGERFGLASQIRPAVADERRRPTSDARTTP